MTRKIFLTIALIVTACNLTLGVAYAAVCQSSGGARACGASCTTLSGGACACQGACSADERNWVAGTKAAEAAEIEEGNAY